MGGAGGSLLGAYFMDWEGGRRDGWVYGRDGWQGVCRGVCWDYRCGMRRVNWCSRCSFMFSVLGGDSRGAVGGGCRGGVHRRVGCVVYVGCRIRALRFRGRTTFSLFPLFYL